MEYYLGTPLSSKLIRNPFRKDRKPTCGFYYSTKGRLYLHDFATEEHMDIFTIVQKKFGLNYLEALKRLEQDKTFLKETEGSIETRELVFDYTTKGFEDINYYTRFSIQNSTLDTFNVLNARVIYESEIAVMRSSRDNPIFIYKFKTGNIKTYAPLHPDPLKKWGGNARIYDVFGWDQLPKKGKLCIITSSAKDVMCLYELGFPAIAFSSEGAGTGKGSETFVKAVVEALLKRFEHVVFYMDNDEPGIKYSLKLSTMYKLPCMWNKPGPKDLSDCVKKYKRLKAFRNLKQLIGRTLKIKQNNLPY